MSEREPMLTVRRGPFPLSHCLGTVFAAVALGAIALGATAVPAAASATSGTTISGTVFQPSSTTPEPGANVQVYDASNGQFVFGTNPQYDGSGGYSVTLPGDGSYWVAASQPSGANTMAPNYIPVSVSGGTATCQPASCDITLNTPDVTGTVEHGTTPEANVNVSASNTGTNEPVPGNILTDSNGDYAFYLPPSGSFQLDANPPQGGNPPLAQGTLGVTTNGSTPPVSSCGTSCNISVPTANVYGQIFQTNGSTPASGGNVQVFQSNGQYVPNEGSGTDSSGDYDLYLANGTYTVVANPPLGTSGAAPTGVPVTISGGALSGAANPLNITLHAPNVSGTVSGSGSPVPNANVGATNISNNTPVPGNVQTDSTGAYGLYLPAAGTYNIQASPQPGSGLSNGNLSVTIDSSGASNCTTSCDITLSTPNVTGTVFAPGGTTAEAGANVQVFESDGQFVQNLGTSTDQSGNYSLAVPDGSYLLAASPPPGASGMAPADIPVSVSSGSATCQPASCDITLNTPNVSGQVVDASGTAVANVNVNAFDTTTTSPVLGNVQTGSSGDYALYLSPGATYQINAFPQPGSGLVQGSISVSVDGSGTATCAGSQPNPCNIVLPAPDVSGTVLAPNGTTAEVNADVQVEQSNGQFVQNAFTQTGQNGGYALYLPTGSYDIVASPPQGSSGMAPSYIPVTVSSGTATCQPASCDITLQIPNVTGQVLHNGAGVANVGIGANDVSTQDQVIGANTQTDQNGNFAVYLPPGATYQINAFPQPGSGLVQGSISVSVSSQGAVSPGCPCDITLPAPNVIGHVYDPSRNPVQGSDINAFNSQNNQFVQGAFAQSQSDGGYDLYLPPGSYTLSAQAPQPNPENLAQGSTSVTIGSGGSLTAGSPDITLVASNLFGYVYEPGTTTGVQNANINVNDASTGQPLQNGFANTSQSGGYALNLPNGTYDVSVQAPFGTSWSGNTCTVTIASGAVSNVTGGTPACTLSSGALDIQLSTPDVVGYLYEPGTANGVGFSSIQVFDDSTQQYLNVPPPQTASSGAFALSLPDGSYTLNASPPNNPSGSTGTVYAGNSCDITVSGSPSSVTAASGGTPGCSLSSGHVVMYLATPTLYGQVLLPASSGCTSCGVQTWVQVLDNSTGQYLNNLWGGTDQDGNYALALPDGSYTLIGQAPFDNSGGYGEGTRTITVSGGALTSPANSPVDITLTVANVTGTVFAPDGSPQANVGINVQDSNGNFIPSAGTGTNGNGDFAITLSQGTYTITAQPQFGSATETSGSITVTVSSNGTASPSPADITLQKPNVEGLVTDSGGIPVQNTWVQPLPQNGGPPPPGSGGLTGSNGEFGLTIADGQWQIQVQPPPDGGTNVTQTTCQVTISSGAIASSPPPTALGSGTCSLNGSGQLQVAMARPNVTGTIFAPDGTTPVPFSNINVEDANGNPVNLWANSNQNGQYGLTLPVPSTGSTTYTLVANPPYQGSATYGNGSTTVTVSSTGTASPNPAGIDLTNPNVSGTVTAGGTAEPNVWVEVRDASTQQDLPNDFSSTNASGSYALTLPNGSYTLIFHTPFDSSGGYAPVAVDVSISAGLLSSTVTSDPAGNATVSGGALDVSLVPANFTGTVANPGGQLASQVGMQAFDNNNNGQPLPYNSNTDGNGSFAMYLPSNGSFTVTAFPPPDDPGVVPVSLQVTTAANGTVTCVANANATCPTASTAALTLEAANVTGTVLDPNGNPVANTGVDVLDSSGSFVQGAHGFTDPKGNFSLALPAGTYTLVAHAPQGSGWADGNAPVTVPSSGSVTQNVSLTVANFTGTVETSSGTAIEGVIVSTTVNGSVVSAVSGSGGSFALSLPAGTYTIELTPPNRDTTDQPASYPGQTSPNSNVTLNLN